MKKLLLLLPVLLLLATACAENDIACDTVNNGCVGLPITWTIEGAYESANVYIVSEEMPRASFGPGSGSLVYTPEAGGEYVLVVTRENGDVYLSGITHVEGALYMGIYEQDGKAATSDPIEWTILGAEDGKALVISKYILHNNSYFNPWWIKFKYTYWAKSYVGDYSENYYSSQPKDPSRLFTNITPTSIPMQDRKTRGTEEDLYETEMHCRYWCNDMFYVDAFTDEEKARILLTHNENPDNEQFGIPGGPDTDDYIFFLSYPEMLRYMPTDASRKCTQTISAKYEGKGNDGNYWWLRTPGNWPFQAVMIYGTNGHISMAGSDVGHDNVGYRPCMWIKIGG